MGAAESESTAAGGQVEWVQRSTLADKCANIMADMSAIKQAAALVRRDPLNPHRKLTTYMPTQIKVSVQRKTQRSVSEIAGMIEKLKLERTALKRDIAADDDGIFEFMGARGLLERKIEDCEINLKKNRETIKNFGECIGPLEKQYESLQKDPKVRFEDARKFYDIAIQMLIEKFDYNPAFKRPGDQI